MLKHKGVDVEEVKPLAKCWRGIDGKITHLELREVVHNAEYRIDARHTVRSNQEERDATLIAWNYANLPMRVKVNKLKI
jgi:hypothetical protein